MYIHTHLQVGSSPKNDVGPYTVSVSSSHNFQLRVLEYPSITSIYLIRRVSNDTSCNLRPFLSCSTRLRYPVFTQSNLYHCYRLTSWTPPEGLSLRNNSSDLILQVAIRDVLKSLSSL